MIDGSNLTTYLNISDTIFTKIMFRYGCLSVKSMG